MKLTRDFQDKLELPGYFVFGEGFHGCHIASWIAIKRADKTKGIMLASPGFIKEASHHPSFSASADDQFQPKETMDMIHQVGSVYKAAKAANGEKAPVPDEFLDAADGKAHQPRSMLPRLTQETPGYFLGSDHRLDSRRSEFRQMLQMRCTLSEPTSCRLQADLRDRWCWAHGQ